MNILLNYHYGQICWDIEELSWNLIRNTVIQGLFSLVGSATPQVCKIALSGPISS